MARTGTDALDDPRALSAVPLVDPSAYRPDSTLAWDRRTGRW
jgi:hypothetical protein